MTSVAITLFNQLNVTKSEISDFEKAFSNQDEVFLTGEFRTPRNTKKMFTLVHGQGKTTRGKFDLSVDFRQPQVVLTLTDVDGREYQLSFPTQALHTGNKTKLLMSFSKLSQPYNSLSLFVDCMDMGVDQTELEIIEAHKDMQLITENYSKTVRWANTCCVQRIS
ncbi:hypothetical protein Btru_059615 [Bulinus truncatus]|nr:hypothetical protein Btru_059615 [Bulinus truncatus]